MSMTKEQEEHLQEIKNDFCQSNDMKYRFGAAEHGGDLGGKTTLDFIREAKGEAIDLFNYLHEAEKREMRRIEMEQNNYKDFESKEAE